MTTSQNKQPYEIGSVTSKDGTTIGYRRLGTGPGLILVHGGAQAAQNLMRLATALADSFTVHVPDRRGRGLSGGPAERYGLAAETEDLAALIARTGAHNVFGLSSGALICLNTALTVPDVHKLAVYEPPLSTHHSTPTQWVGRYEHELSQGRVGAAMLTAMLGTQTAPPLMRMLPRFVLDPMLDRMARLGAEGRQAEPETDPGHASLPLKALGGALWPLRRLNRADAPDAETADPHDVPLVDLVPTMRYDARVVTDGENTIGAYADLTAEVLLMGGGSSPAYLKQSLAALDRVLPKARKVTLPGMGHHAPDNSGLPEVVAWHLRTFFSDSASSATARSDH